MSSRGERGDDDDPREWIDYSENSAERVYRSADGDKNAPHEDLGITDGETKFHAFEGDGPTKWGRLHSQDVSGEDEPRTKKRNQRRKRDLELLKDRLELTEYQYERATHLFETLTEEGDLRFGRYPAEATLIALVAIACADRGRRDITEEDQFEAVVERFVPATGNNNNPPSIVSLWAVLAEELDDVGTYHEML